MDAKLRNIRRMTPRKVVEHQFRSLESFVKNLLLENKNIMTTGRFGDPVPGHELEANPTSIGFYLSKIRPRATEIVGRIGEMKELCMDMAADADPTASRLWQIKAPDLEIERFICAETMDAAVSFFEAHLKRDGVDNAEVEILIHQIPPEDAVTDGVISPDITSRESRTLVIGSPELDEESTGFEP